jgi:NAD(P)-dependent dehydrogenase (short-subunit alcohol dehydrogenase family)
MKKGVIITGVGKGLGRQIFKYFTEKKVFVYGITRSKKDIIDLLNNKYCKIYISDIRKINVINKILKDSIKNKIEINGMINNAGIRQRILFDKITNSNLQEVFDINFFSIFKIMQIFFSHCKKYKIKSSIVNIGSIVGSLGFNGLSGYSASKGALNSFTRSFAVEAAKYNIRANIIEPGFIKTSYYEKFKRTPLYKWTLSRIPMKRWGESCEVSKLVYFLYSSDSSYITGETIAVDGGWKNS